MEPNVGAHAVIGRRGSSVGVNRRDAAFGRLGVGWKRGNLQFFSRYLERVACEPTGRYCEGIDGQLHFHCGHFSGQGVGRWKETVKG